MRRTIYLGLGSNLGDRAANLEQAMAGLAGAGIEILKRSSLYATEPLGFGTQNWFLNCVVEAATELMPRQLLHSTQQVERDMGRRRLVRGGPRTVDIDILLYAANAVRMADLEIPHPRIAERRFVLVPLREIAPGLRHPILRRTIGELLAATADRSEIHRWQPAGNPAAALAQGNAGVDSP